MSSKPIGVSGLVLGIVFLLVGIASQGANARYIETVDRSGFEIPCEGDLCYQTIFCWRGARFYDLNQLTTRVKAQVDFEDERDACLDAESDDVLSIRALAFGFENDTAALRLRNRIDNEHNWFTSLLLSAIGQGQVAGDGECHGTKCNVFLSPYHSSCIRMCGKPPTDGRKIKAIVTFHTESAINVRSIYVPLFGLAIIAAAPYLSKRREMFYFTGGSLGVICAVSLLVLIVSRIATKSGPTRGQLGIAAFLQVGVVYMRKMMYEFVKDYVDWIALYVVVTFLASLSLVHYFLKGPDGRVAVSSSLQDIVQLALQLFGAFFVSAPIPSARMRLVSLATVFAAGLISSFTESEEQIPRVETPHRVPVGVSVTSAAPYSRNTAPFFTPREHVEEEIRYQRSTGKANSVNGARQDDEGLVEWIKENIHRIQILPDGTEANDDGETVEVESDDEVEEDQ